MINSTDSNKFITTALQFAETHKLLTYNYSGKNKLSFQNEHGEDFVPDHYFDYSRYSSIILKDFDLQDSILKLTQTLKPYIKYLNIKIDFERLRLHQYFKIGLKSGYTSLQDVLYLNIQLVNLNPSTKILQERITIRYYFTPIEAYFKQYLFDVNDSDCFVLHVYYKDLDSSIIALLNNNKQKIENILGYTINDVDQDTVDLVSMAMI